MKWIFAKNEGGRDSGFHDAGVETFRGNFDQYLARELIQNSLDARLDSNKPVHVKFELLELRREQIPDFSNLTAAFSRCVEYWEHSEKAQKFFKKAETIAKQPTIKALRIRDYNTTGVIGGDLERDKNWYSLVRCAGSSSKGAGEGGSFGIGKNAPFAASLLRTVLYSTFNVENEHIFQGVSTLTSHFLSNGSIAQPTGFLGGEHGESVRSRKEIPKPFLRNEKGLDVTALGFPADPNWQRGLAFSVLDNFWPAIDFGDLEVTVGSQNISRRNLASLLDAFSGDEEFTAHIFYRAFKNPTNPFQTQLTRLKDVSLYLLTAEGELPKRVAMIRKTGMVIFRKQFRSILPFCGVFLCRNEAGNILLREMEPPRHDVWDANHPDKGANRKIEREYMDFIRDSIKKLVPLDDAKVIAVPGLNRFLPDDDESQEESFDGEADVPAEQETPERQPLPEKIQGKKINPGRRTMQPDQTQTEDEGEEETNVGVGDGPGGYGGGGEGNGSGGRYGGGEGQGEKGGKGGTTSKPTVPIRYRAFSINPGAGVYAVTAAPEVKTNHEVQLAVWAVGDDQKTPMEVKTARHASGESIPVSALGILGPLKFPRDKALRIEIVLEEPLRVAMEISAYEA